MFWDSRNLPAFAAAVEDAGRRADKLRLAYQGYLANALRQKAWWRL